MGSNMKIQLAKELSKQDSDLLFHWRERVFPHEGAKLDWSQPDWHLVASDSESVPVAHLGYSGYLVELDGEEEQTVVGVGGVVVRPEYQGQHIPGLLFEHLHGSRHALEISSIFTLFCPFRLERYYRKHGYKSFQGDVSFMQGPVRTRSENIRFMHRGSLEGSRTVRLRCEPW